jgi:hypothetical protein
MGSHEVRVLTWVKASNADIRSGLLGFISIEFGLLVLDGICLRRTSDNRFALSYPARTDRAGRRHAYIKPVDNAARIEIERQILSQLGQRENATMEASDE